LKQRQVIDRTTTPEGPVLELALEADGNYVIRLGRVPLMSSSVFGSEREMAIVARRMLADRPSCKVLIGGLGMGYTCRSALDEFGPDAAITVAELRPQVVAYNRGPLGPLADHPLRDPRMTLFEGNVKKQFTPGTWDAILIDVDNGPDDKSTRSNNPLYGIKGASLMAHALAPGGVLVVWSVDSSRPFEGAMRSAGLTVETQRVYARTEARKGPKHTLFIGRAAQ
jgi:spermidine synthase